MHKASRVVSEDEEKQIWRFLLETEEVSGPTNLWKKFKQTTGSSRTTSALYNRFKYNMSPRVHLADLSAEEKATIYKRYKIEVDPEFRENLIELGYTIDDQGFVVENIDSEEPKNAPRAGRGRKRQSAARGASRRKQARTTVAQVAPDLPEEPEDSEEQEVAPEPEPEAPKEPEAAPALRNNRQRRAQAPPTPRVKAEPVNEPEIEIINVDVKPRVARYDAPQNEIDSAPITPITPNAPVFPGNLNTSSIMELIEKSTREALERQRSSISKQLGVKSILNALLQMEISENHKNRIDSKIAALGRGDKKVSVERIRSVLDSALNILDI